MALRVALLLVVFFLAADAGTPAQDRTAHFDSDGVQIHYADRGRGEPVALIRGVTASGGDGPTDDEIAALNASLFARNDPDALAAVARSLPALYEVRGESLRAVALPVLAIIGEHDGNLEAVNRMAGVMADLEVVAIAGASHASRVRPSAEPLVRFLDRHRAR